MFSVWNSVKAKEGTARFPQAGVVHATNPAKPEEVQVRWDVDGTIEAVAVADLTLLG